MLTFKEKMIKYEELTGKRHDLERRLDDLTEFIQVSDEHVESIYVTKHVFDSVTNSYLFTEDMVIPTDLVKYLKDGAIEEFDKASQELSKIETQIIEMEESRE